MAGWGWAGAEKTRGNVGVVQMEVVVDHLHSHMKIDSRLWHRQELCNILRALLLATNVHIQRAP